MKIRIPLGIKGNGVVKSTSKFGQTYGNTSTFTYNTFGRYPLIILRHTSELPCLKFAF